MAGWEDDQQNGRRFPHRSQGRNKTSNRNAKSGDGGVFQPRNMLGRYIVQCPFIEKINAGRSPDDVVSDKYMEIHELVESQTGYLATFNFGALSGVMLIAGSRKALKGIVEDAENHDEVDSEDSNDEAEQSGSDQMTNDEEATATSDEEPEEPTDEFEAPPDRDRPSHAFEKNTFRTPKWFGQWRGRCSSTEAESDVVHTTCDAENKAHFEFSSAACREFKATFSCPYLDAKEVAMKGWRITGKAAPTTMTWTDFIS